jgi:hypothetical protein
MHVTDSESDFLQRYRSNLVRANATAFIAVSSDLYPIFSILLAWPCRQYDVLSRHLPERRGPLDAPAEIVTVAPQNDSRNFVLESLFSNSSLKTKFDLT